MKSLITATLLLFSLQSFATQNQDLDPMIGLWEGAYKDGTKCWLQVKSENGKYTFIGRDWSPMRTYRPSTTPGKQQLEEFYAARRVMAAFSNHNGDEETAEFDPSSDLLTFDSETRGQDLFCGMANETKGQEMTLRQYKQYYGKDTFVYRHRLYSQMQIQMSDMKEPSSVVWIEGADGSSLFTRKLEEKSANLSPALAKAMIKRARKPACKKLKEAIEEAQVQLKDKSKFGKYKSSYSQGWSCSGMKKVDALPKRTETEIRLVDANQDG